MCFHGLRKYLAGGQLASIRVQGKVQVPVRRGCVVRRASVSAGPHGTRRLCARRELTALSRRVREGRDDEGLDVPPQVSAEAEEGSEFANGGGHLHLAHGLDLGRRRPYT